MNPNWLDRAGEWTERIRIHLVRGEFPACHELIDEAEVELKKLRQPKTPLDMAQVREWKISQLAISTRTENLLAVAGIMTVEQLLEKRPEQLLERRNLGLRALAEIYEALRKVGIGPPDNHS